MSHLLTSGEKGGFYALRARRCEGGSLGARKKTGRVRAP
jgi:hypothetical protein